MKKKKILAGVATAAIIAPIVAQASGVNNLNIADKILLADQLPIQIQVGTPEITKTGNVYTGTNTNTVPATTVATNSPNVTSGVSVTYSIPMSINSTNGKKFNIPNIVVTANPVITYDGPQTPQKEAIAKEIAAQIKSDVYNSGQVNSSYSGVPKITLNIGNVDWGMTIQPNITVKVGGKTIPVKVPDLKTTTKYITNVYGEIEQPGPDGLVPIQIYSTPSSNEKYYYNSTLSPVKSLTFKMSISGKNGKLEVNPAFANNPDMHYNPATGECTLTGALAAGKKFNNLFKVVPIDSKELTEVTVSVEPTGITYVNNNGGNEGTKVPGLISTANWGHSAIYTGLPDSKELSGKYAINMSNDCKVYGGGQGIPKVVCKSVINFKKQVGNWNVLGMTYLPKGKMVTSIGGQSEVDPNAIYLQLTPSQLKILATGTPIEKLNLLKDILLGNSETLQNAATGLLIQDKLVTPPKEGYNAVMYNLTNNGSGTTYSGGATIYAMPNQDNPKGTLLAKTLSLAAPGKQTDQISADGVGNLIQGQDAMESVNGNISGLLAGNNNSITTASVSNGASVFGFNNGNGQSTQVRTGELSHDSSAGTFNSTLGTTTWLSTGTGENTLSGNDNTFTSSWLNDSHIVKAKVATPNIGGWGNYTDNSVATFDMHTSHFKITGPMTIGGSTIPKSDITVKGDKIIVNFSKDESYSAGDSFEFPVKFTNPGATTAGYTFSVTGKKAGTAGVSYLVNDKSTDIEQIFNSTFPSKTITNTIISSPINGCLHMDDGVSSTNTSDMSALLQNQSYAPKHYLTIIQIPKASGNSLPGNEGCPSEGGLGAELQNIETANCPIYVLPKSALNNPATPGGLQTNEQMNNSTNPFDMKGYAKDIESGKSGWVLYKPGMDLSNIASIAAMPTVPAKSTYTFKYKLKLTGVQNNSFQYTTSGFKYWDLNDGVGSLSNVVTLAPNGTDLTHQWDSSVLLQSNGSTRALTPTELKQKVTFTFNNPVTRKNETMTEPLSYLIAHGEDLDPNYDPSPATPKDHLQQNVDLVNDEAGLKAAGYELVKTTVQIGNGAKQEVDGAYFTNQGVAYNNKFTKVVFILKKIKPDVQDQVTVQVNMGTKEKPNYQNVVVNGPGYRAKKGDNPGTQAQPGKAGVPETGASDVKTPTLLPDYKIDDVIVETQNPDGSWTSTTESATFKVPTNLGKTNTHFIYQISKIPAVVVHDTVKVLVNGKTVQPNEGGYVAPQTGKDGDSLTGASGITTPVIPPHYSVTGLTIQTTTPDGKTVTSTVKATMVNGVLSIPVKQADGTTKDIPVSQYKVPTTLGKGNTNIIYNITKDVKDTLTVKVLKPGTKDTYETVTVGQPGYVAPQNGIEGLPEQGASGISNPTIPAGYKIDSIYLNGKEVASTPAEIKALTAKIPSKLGKEDANYVYNISKEVGSLTTQVKVLGTDGKPLTSDPAIQAQETVQGKDGNTPVGTTIDSSKANTIKIGNTSIDLASPDASEALQKLGYKLVGTTISTPDVPAVINTTPAKAGQGTIEDGKTHIVYTVQKLPTYGGVTVQVKNLTTSKDEVAEHEVQRATTGTTFSSATAYKAPEGYTLVTSDTTLNGKNVTASDISTGKISASTVNPYDSDASNTTQEMSGDQHVVYSIVKNVQDTVTVTVDGKPMTEAVSKLPGGKNLMPQTGKEGTPSGYGMPAGASDVQTPVAPNGYKITSLTIDTLGPDGKTVTKTVKTTMVNGVLEIPVVQKDGTTKNVPVSQYTIPTTLGHNDTHFIYNITKEEPVTVKVVTANGTPITTTTTNNVKVGSSDFTNVQNGLPTDSVNSKDTGINVPNGYHISGITINGTEVKPNGDGKYVVPTTDKIGTNGTKIVYTLTKNAYQTVVTVTDGSGKKVPGVTIPPVINTPAGGTVTGTSTTVKIPNGWKIVKVTEGTGLKDSKGDTPVAHTSTVDASNGITTASVTKNITDVTSNHHIHYVVEKVGNVTVTVNYKNAEGKIVPFTENGYKGQQHPVEPDTTLGGDITGTSIVVPKGYRVVATTVNTPDGKTTNVTDVTTTDGKTTSKTLADTPLQQGTTHVVYTIEKIPTGSVTVSVVNEQGKSVGIPTTTTVKNAEVTNANGDKTPLTGYELSPTTIATLKKEGYELVPAKTTVQVNDGKTSKTTQADLAKDSLSQGVTKITYVVKKIPVVGTVGVKVVTTNGVVVSDAPTVQSSDVGTPIDSSKTVMPKLPAKYKNYHLVKTVITTPDGKTPKSVDGVDITKGNTEVTYTIAPNTGSVTVTVNIVGKDGKTIESTPVKETTVQTGYQGADISSNANLANIKGVPAGYHLVSATVNGQGENVKLGKDSKGNDNGTVTGQLGNGAEHIVYNIEKDAPKTSNVTVEVKTASGKVLTKEHPVATGNIGSTIDSTKTSIVVPKGYHITGTNTVNGSDVKVTTTTNKDGQTVVNVPTEKYGDKTTKIVYTVAPNVGKVTVEVRVKNSDGTYSIVHATKTVQTGDEGTALNGDANYAKQDIPAGYHLVETQVNNKTQTVDGKPMTTLTGTVPNGTTSVVYTIEKDAPKTGKVNVIVNIVKKVDGKYQVQSTPVQSTTVASGDTGTGIGTKANLDNIPNIPKGYHLVTDSIEQPSTSKITLGKDAKGNANGTVIGNIPDGTATITYNIAKDMGSITATVNIVNADNPKEIISTPVKNVTVIPETETGANIGTKADLSNITGVPKGYHLVGTTTVTQPKGSDIKIGPKGETITGTVPNGAAHVTYNIAKNVTNKVTYTIVTNDKTPVTLVPVTSVKDGVVPGTKVTTQTITIPKGYHLVPETPITGNTGTPTYTTQVVNGKTEIVITTPTSSDVNVEKDTHIKIVVAKDKTYTTKVTVSTADGSKLPSGVVIPKEQTTDAGETVSANSTKVVVPKGYHITEVTSQVGTEKPTPTKTTQTTNKITGAITAQTPAINNIQANHTIHYVITKNAPKMGNVTVEVKTEDGVILTKAHQVTKGNVGTKINSTETSIVVPKGYQIVPEITVNGKQVDANTVNGVGVKITETTKDGVTMVNVPTGNIIDGTTKIVYVVKKAPVAPKTGNVKVNVQIVDGNDTSKVLSTPVKGLTVQTGDVGTVITNKADLLNIPEVPKGYHIVGKTTVTMPKGSDVKLGTDGTSITGNIAEGTTEVTYHIAKNEGSVTATVNIVNADNPKEIISTPVKNVTVIPETETGANIGTKADLANIPGVPKGYHLVGTTTVTQPKGSDIKIGPKGETITGTVPNGAAHVTYNIAKNVTNKVTYTIVTNDKTPVTLVPVTSVKDGVVPGTKVTTQTITIPKGYHLVPETPITGNTGTPTYTTKVVNGKTEIVITTPTSSDVNVEKDTHIKIVVAKDKSIPKYTTKVTYVTPDGTVVVPSAEVGTPVVGGSTVGINVNVPKGYKIDEGVPVTNNGKAISGVTPKDGKSFNVTTGTASEGHNNNIVITIQKTGTVSVAVMVKNPKTGKVSVFNDSTIKGAEHVVDTDVIGAVAKHTGISVPKGYHLVSTTISGTKATASDVAGIKVASKNTEVVYTIEKDAPVVNKGVVTSTVVGTDGTVYTPVHDVTKDGGSPIGTEVTGSGVTITPPANTKITKVTVDGKEVKATPNSNGTYSIPSVKVNTKEQHIVWTVQKIGNVDVTVQIVKKVGDKYVVESTPVSNKQVINEANDGTNITGANYSDVKSLVPAGYHLVASSYTSPKIGNVTLGTGSNLGTVTGTVEQGTTHIVYQIVKDTPAPKVGNVTVEIKTTSGKILVQPHEVTSGKVGDKIDNTKTSIVVPKGYHISGTNTVDGSPVNITTTTNKEGQTVVNVPDGNFKDGTTKIVYTVTKDTPVVNTGNVVVTINEVGANGHLIKTIVKDHSVMSDKNVGTEIAGANYSNVQSLVPAGYHLVSSSLSKGADASVDKGTVTGKVISGTTEVIYNITKNAPTPKPQPKIGSVVTNIATTDGTVVSQGTPITGTTGADITAGDTAYNPPKTIKGYHVVGLTVNGKSIKSVNGAYKVPSGMTFGDGTTQHVTWIIGKDALTPKPQPKTGNVVVTINIVDANGNVISTPVNNDQVVNGAEVGSAITGANYNTVATANNIPAGYHLVKTVVTNPNGKTQTYTAGVVGGTVQEGTTHVVYSIEKDAPKPPVKPDVKYGEVKVTVVTTNGDVLVPNHLVEKNVVGTEVTKGIGYENIPGYTLTGTTVDGVQKGSVSVSKVTLPDGTIQIIYTVTKIPTPPVTPMQREGSVKVEVVTASGKIVVPNHTVTNGTEGTIVTEGIGYNNIPGYHLLGTSVNGNDKGKVSISTVTLTDGTTQIIYTIGKDATPVKPTPENPPVKPTPENPPVQQTIGKVTVKVVNTNGDVVVGTHTVSQGVTGGEVTGTGYNPPAGYKITKITIDGKEVKYVPSMEIPDGTTSIVYTISKDATPDVKPTPDAKYGNVTIKVVTESGKVIVEQHEVANGIVGTQVTSSTTNYKVPNGYHLVKETVNGKEVSSNSDITLTEGTTKIVYVIAKNVVKPDTGNGIVNPPVQPEVKPDGGDGTVNPSVQPNSVNNANVPEIVPPLTGDKTGTVIITPEPTENNTPVVVNNISNVNEIPVVRVNSNTTAKISGLADTGTDESSNNATKDLAGLAGLVAVLGLGFLLKRKK